MNTAGGAPKTLKELLDFINSFKNHGPSAYDLDTIYKSAKSLACARESLHAVFSLHELLLDAVNKEGVRHPETGTRITAALYDRELELLQNTERSAIDLFVEGSTLLQHACGISNPEVVLIILEKGADPTLASKGDDDHPGGWSPVEIVSQSLNGTKDTRAECISLLLADHH